ncbi:MAG: CGGC domain-containing protein [Victivallaceae bacterium]
MSDAIKLLVIIQCDLVLQRCPGFFCDRAFVNKTGGFKDLKLDEFTRKLNISCGGCCGRAIHRKLQLLAEKAQKYDNIQKSDIHVKLASCIAKDNYHGPPCPHLEYIRKLIDKTGLKFSMDTNVSEKAEKLRNEGVYQS